MRKPPPGFPQTSVTSFRTFEARNSLYMFKSFYGKPCAYDRAVSARQSCSVILFKTCNEMEAPYINYAKSQFKKPVLLVGPLPPEPRPDQLDEKWAKWLDKFEANSVIYCSFGSETFLTDDQIKELASGLELTGLPFFLVLNFPANSADFGTQKGCYLCHAGFSSVIEAIVNDCQLVMLPQKGDQYVNLKLAHGDLKAGVEVNRNDEDGFFGREDIRRAVEKVMFNIDEEPAKSIRNNQRKWKEFLTFCLIDSINFHQLIPSTSMSMI